MGAVLTSQTHPSLWGCPSHTFLSAKSKAYVLSLSLGVMQSFDLFFVFYMFQRAQKHALKNDMSSHHLLSNQAFLPSCVSSTTSAVLAKNSSISILDGDRGVAQLGFVGVFEPAGQITPCSFHPLYPDLSRSTADVCQPAVRPAVQTALDLNVCQ